MIMPEHEIERSELWSELERAVQAAANAASADGSTRKFQVRGVR
jgi:hypothetical protein